MPDVHSIASYAMMTIFFLLTMVFFLDRHLYNRAAWIHHFCLALLLLWWAIALVFLPLSAKFYGGLLVIAVIVEEILVRRRRRQSNVAL